MLLCTLTQVVKSTKLSQAISNNKQANKQAFYFKLSLKLMLNHYEGSAVYTTLDYAYQYLHSVLKTEQFCFLAFQTINRFNKKII